VETIGLWAGLLSAVVSIVLSIVAILFARDVDRRSMEISNQTIRSLEAIQSTVQRLSDDTGGLIKMAWERMLGSVAVAGPHSDGDLQGLLAGLLGEFRQDVSELAPGTGVDELARTVSERVRRAATARIGGERDGTPKSWAFNLAVEAIESLSPFAVEFLRCLESGEHLTRSQYRQLRQDAELAMALDELRDRDLLIPFPQRGAHGGETVYGLAPWFRNLIGPALVFTGHESPSTAESERVMLALRAIGYGYDPRPNGQADGSPHRRSSAS
jgi:hypothetical protein